MFSIEAFNGLYPDFSAKPLGMFPPPAVPFAKPWEVQYRRHIGQAIRMMPQPMRQRLRGVVEQADRDMEVAGLIHGGLGPRLARPAKDMFAMTHVEHAAALAKEEPRVRVIMLMLRRLYMDRVKAVLSGQLAPIAEIQKRLNAIGQIVRDETHGSR